MRRRTIAAAAGLVLVVLAGCSPGDAGAEGTIGGAATPSPSGTTPSGTGSSSSAPGARPVTTPTVTGVVARDLVVPWGLAFVPGGDALIAERDSGRVLRVDGAGAARVVGTVPGVEARGEGGLLGLAVAPDDARTVFAYLTSDEGDNRVVALPFDGSRFGTPRTVIDGIPAAGNHNGGRLAVGPDGLLWIGTGDASDRSTSQDRASLGGKILRVTRTGAIPADNPFPGSPVWSYGHRNVQGLAFDSAGRLWATEFGQNTYDELNRVERGGNHGWPQVEGTTTRSGYVNPQVTWATSEASPSGLAIVDDVAYVAALRGARLWQVPLTGGSAGTPVAALTGYGRLRTVEPAPDGTLWVTTSNRDRRGDPADGDDQVLVVRR